MMLNDECSILLIDDDVDVATPIPKCLEQAGYRVRGFTILSKVKLGKSG